MSQNLGGGDLATLLFRMSAIEQQFQQFQAQSQQAMAGLQEQMRAFVSVRENDRQLQNIQETVSRIERDMRDGYTRFEQDMQELRRLMADEQLRLQAQEREVIKRESVLRATIDRIQIQALAFAVTSVVLIITGILVGYITHFFH